MAIASDADRNHSIAHTQMVVWCNDLHHHDGRAPRIKRVLGIASKLLYGPSNPLRSQQQRLVNRWFAASNTPEEAISSHRCLPWPSTTQTKRILCTSWVLVLLIVALEPCPPSTNYSYYFNYFNYYYYYYYYYTHAINGREDGGVNNRTQCDNMQAAGGRQLVLSRGA
jgi:hypothetical protein